jgi:hypothetical protein
LAVRKAQCHAHLATHDFYTHCACGATQIFAARPCTIDPHGVYAAFAFVATTILQARILCAAVYSPRVYATVIFQTRAVRAAIIAARVHRIKGGMPFQYPHRRAGGAQQHGIP